MPYIADTKKRIKLDKIVNEMGEILELNGDLNYLLFAFCKRHVDLSYNTYKNFIGELNETIAELRRRYLSELEDRKMRENGDV